MPGFFNTAKKVFTLGREEEKWPVRDKEQLDQHWENFNSLLQNSIRQQRFGLHGLSEESHALIQDMYKHLEYRVQLAENTLEESNLKCLEKEAELQNCI